MLSNGPQGYHNNDDDEVVQRMETTRISIIDARACELLCYAEAPHPAFRQPARVATILYTYSNTAAYR